MRNVIKIENKYNSYIKINDKMFNCSKRLRLKGKTPGYTLLNDYESYTFLCRAIIVSNKDNALF